MKHIKLFEQFIAEKKAGDYTAYIDDKRSLGGTDKSVTNEAKSFLFSFNYNTDEDDVDYIQGVLTDAGVDAIAQPGLDSEKMEVKAKNAVELRKAKKAIKADGFEINESTVNEDLGVIDIALGVATGIAGLWAVVQGLPLVGRALGNAAEALADQIEARVKSVAKGKRKGLIEEIVKKFDSDTKLKQMYQDLPEYMERGDHSRIIRNNTERRKQLTAIGNYVKTKLTPEEMQYFTDISSMLRTGDVK